MESVEKNESSFIAVGKEEHTGRHLFSIKDPSVSEAGGQQAGVYLDQCVCIMTIEEGDAFWIFWLSPDATGKVKGHTASGRRNDGEEDLSGFRRDLLSAGFPRRNLHVADSLVTARTILVENVKVTPEAAVSIVDYLVKNKDGR